MMEDKNLTTEESIALITRMIENTRRNFSTGGGAMFLIWGYTTIAVTLAVLAALHLTQSPLVMWLWCAIPAVGGVLTWRHARRHRRPVTTHLDKSVAAVWRISAGVAACCMVSIYASVLTDGKPYIDILFSIGLLMSMATAITGRLIGSRLIVIGGSIGIGLSSALPAFAGDMMRQLLLFAVIFLVAQVIPGHLLNRACKREAREMAVKNGRAA